MEKSENINELASALSKAQGEMKPAHMNKTNPFFKNKYADLQSVWDSIRVSFSKHGLSITQTVHTDDKGSYLLTNLLHSSGQWLTSSIKLNPVKQDPQGVGSAITYARRYALSAIAGVCSDEDDDANMASGKEPKILSASETKTLASATKNAKANDSSGEFVIEFGTDIKGKKIKDLPEDKIKEVLHWAMTTRAMPRFQLAATEYLKAISMNV